MYFVYFVNEFRPTCVLQRSSISSFSPRKWVFNLRKLKFTNKTFPNHFSLIPGTSQFCHCSKHWLVLTLPLMASFESKALSFIPLDLGFTASMLLPQVEHNSSWSVLFLLGPDKHHFPGTTPLAERLRMIWSIFSSTRSPSSNRLAKAAPLVTIVSYWGSFRIWGSPVSVGLSQTMNLRSLFTVVFWNSGVLHMTVWK